MCIHYWPLPLWFIVIKTVNKLSLAKQIQCLIVNCRQQYCMKNIAIGLILLSLLISCGSKKIPDVSGIKVDLQLQRFDKDFFALGTSQIDQSLQQLHKKYPGFLQDFLFNILALPPQPDSNKVVEQLIIQYIQSYKPLSDSAENVFADMSAVQDEITKGLQFVKYYYPDYKLPTKLVTFIGPIDSYGNILTTDALAVGLQLYMGNNFSVYKTDAVQEQYPAYISRRFKKEYIGVNSIKTIIDDLYPNKASGKSLLEQMIESGKRLYLLDQLMPETADTIKTGYTAIQLEGCYKNESTIWSFFVQNDLLYITDPSAIRDYMNDAPKTQVFGENSPGMIGQFVGWQIVKKWMAKNESVKPDELMKTDTKTIFEGAKYKP